MPKEPVVIAASTYAFANGKLVLAGPKRPEKRPPQALDRWLSWLCQTEAFHDGQCIFMRRFTLGRVGGWRLYLHHWLANDWEGRLHDHSRDMLSVGLWGSYTEELEHGLQRWTAPWWHFFKAAHRHHVIVNTPSVWTLVLTWPKSAHSGFYKNGRRIPVHEDIWRNESQRMC